MAPELRSLGVAVGLIVLLATAAPANGAVTAVLGPSGDLQVTSDGAGDTFAISCSGGNVVVTNAAITANCADVQSITVNADGGNDTLDASAVTVQSFPSLPFDDGVTANMDAGLDHVTGSPHSDFLNGGIDADTILGGAGDVDQIDPGPGPNNVVDGGPGFDLIRSASGPDNLDGGPDEDRIEAIGGPHTLSATTLSGPAGPDVLANFEFATLEGSGAADTIDAEAFPGEVDIRAGGGPDILRGGPLDDFLGPGTGNDQLFGNGGTDTLEETGLQGDVTLTNAQMTQTTPAEVDQLNSVESAAVSGGANPLKLDASGFSGDTSIQGSDDADELRGGSGPDRIGGGLGDDDLFGQGGDDNVAGEQDDDTMSGGPGFDTVSSGGAGGSSVLGQTVMSGSNVGFDTFAADFEAGELEGDQNGNTLDGSGFGGPVRLFGFEGIDTLLGGSADDTLVGGLDNDTMNGGAGAGDTVREDEFGSFVLRNDQLSGATGTDALTGIERGALDGSDGADTIDASAFSGGVTFRGFSGDDVLVGGAAADTLNGGLGTDTLTGGASLDSFLCGGAPDVLTDATFEETFGDGCVGPAAPTGSGVTPGAGGGGTPGSGTGGTGSGVTGLAAGTYGIRRGRARLTASLDLQIPLTNTTTTPFGVRVEATEVRDVARVVPAKRKRFRLRTVRRRLINPGRTVTITLRAPRADAAALRRSFRSRRRITRRPRITIRNLLTDVTRTSTVRVTRRR